jgi:hypothetical protein
MEIRQNKQLALQLNTHGRKPEGDPISGTGCGFN